MGVLTPLSLKQSNKLFISYNFCTLEATKEGLIDTTYFASNEMQSYVLKKYEREITQQVQRDTNLLQMLHAKGLNVSLCLTHNAEWYLYKRLKGKQAKNTQYFHIVALARFLAKLHHITKEQSEYNAFLEKYDLNFFLYTLKKRDFFYYKKLSDLKGLTLQNDGLIHGDIFKDNTLFDGEKIAVFDFIDAGTGSFVFDISVALLAFNPSNKTSLTQLFLQIYNQKTVKKIQKKELLKNIQIATKFYALLRIHRDKNSSRAKELLFR